MLSFTTRGKARIVKCWRAISSSISFLSTDALRRRKLLARSYDDGFWVRETHARQAFPTREKTLRLLRRIYCASTRVPIEWHQSLPPRLAAGGQPVMKSPSGAGREVVRILVADSNQTQSQLLSSALRRQPGMRVAYSHGELSDCLRALQETPVDILLLGDGHSDSEELIHTLRAIHSNYPHVGLVLLLDSYDRSLVVNALRAGARGLFCRARQPFRALCRCISVVHQGQFWTNTEQMTYVIEALVSSPAVRVINAKGEGLLTPREEQVVNLVAEGIANREIAQQLGIRENTVKKSLFRIYDKLGVSNRVELVLYALTHRGAGQAHTAPQSVASPAVPNPRLGVTRIAMGLLASGHGVEGDFSRSVLAPIQRDAAPVSDSASLLED